MLPKSCLKPGSKQAQADICLPSLVKTNSRGLGLLFTAFMDRFLFSFSFFFHRTIFAPGVNLGLLKNFLKSQGNVLP